MKKELTCLLAAVAIAFGSGSISAKKALSHEDLDIWNKLTVNPLSNNGEWASFISTPGEGDGYLSLYNTKTGKTITIERGYNPAFTADSQWALALIKPLFKDSRQAKIDKKKDFDAPQDSLAIINLRTGNVEKIARVISYKIGKEGGEWIAYSSSDTALIKPKALKDKKAGKPLVVKNLKNGATKNLKWVKDYVFSRDGSRLAVTTNHHSSDSIAIDGLGVINFPDTSYVVLDMEKKHYGTPVFSEDAALIAYTASNDTTESGTRKMDLYLANLQEAQPSAQQVSVPAYEKEPPLLARPHSDDPEQQARLLEDYEATIRRMQGEALFINQYSKPRFSHNGKRLIIGMAPAIAPDDTTIYDFETPSLDIWRWNAPYTPPEENKLASKIREHTYPLVIDLANFNEVFATTSPLVQVSPSDRWDGDWVLLTDPTEGMVAKQWTYAAPEQLSVKNINTGEVKEVAEVPQESSDISPLGKYVVWFADRAYHVYDIATGKTVEISEGVPYPLWEEEQDIALERQPYGILGWTEGDNDILVYDRYDIWSLDPKGERQPINLTAGNGRKENRRYRYVKTDPEERFIAPGQLMVFNVFDYGDKRNGYATYTMGKPAAPALKTLEQYQFHNLKKAKNAPVYAFRKANFSTSPDMWVAKNADFANAKQASDINPQMKDYSWGTAELFKWYAFDGTPTEGVVYLPEDFDPDKSYPMLAVFYETGSEDLYMHYNMEPSWSWVNYPFYVSRGYVIFQPDIHYTPGVPGESCYNCVVSGVEALLKKYPNIDAQRLGIDGQSWGGYQTAYLVTRTNMFAAAGSGAPVANMTSAYGGIRWGSGNSRQAQYEVGQSRIGRNLWESPQLYLANSPLFYADRIETPLLIMHNDADGAVPWYQGIELFMAMRRLGKPVWMLQYNGEEHNLKERRNRKDITIRLQQFFDHYLKGAPMPEWMERGIPAIRKGQEFGTALIEE